MLPGASREWLTTQNLILARMSGAAVAWATPDAPLVSLTDINRGLWPRHMRKKNAHIYSYVMNNYWQTNYKASQKGKTVFRYMLTSAGKLSDSDVATFDASTLSPLPVYKGYLEGNFVPRSGPLPVSAGSFLKISAGHSIISALKQAEDGDGLILRVRNMAEAPDRLVIKNSLFRLLSAETCNAVEQNCRPFALTNGSAEIQMPAHRFSTLRLRLAPAE